VKNHSYGLETGGGISKKRKVRGEGGVHKNQT